MSETTEDPSHVYGTFVVTTELANFNYLDKARKQDFMKKLITIVGILATSLTANAKNLDAQIADNIICYRNLIYSTSAFVKNEYLKGHVDLITFSTYSTTASEHIPAIRKDVTDKFIDLVTRYSKQNVTLEQAQKDAESCQAMKKSAVKLSSKDDVKDAGIYLPSQMGVGVYKQLETSDLSTGARELIMSTLAKSENCKMLEGILAVGAGVGFGGGLALSYCEGQGGRRWLTAGPQVYGGLGGGGAYMGGVRVTSSRENWNRYVDFKYTGVFGGGYVLGGYGSGNSEGVQGGGVAFGSPGYGFSMAGTRLNFKISPLPNDKNWILDKLGRQQSLPEEIVNPAYAMP